VSAALQSRVAAVPARTSGPSTWSPEFSLLVAAVRSQVGISGAGFAGAQSLDWRYLSRLAEFHHVAPIVCNSLCAGQAPPAEHAALRSAFDRNLRRNLALSAELLRISDLLTQHGVPHVPYKGPLLAETVYGNLGLRSFVDLDILVPREHVLRAKRLLLANGFSEPDALDSALDAHYLHFGSEWVLVNPTADCQVELQWELMPRHSVLPLDVTALVARSVTVEFGGRRLQSLSPEDLFLVISLHGSKHRWKRLLWLGDVAATLRTYAGMDFGLILQRAQQMGARRMFLLGPLLAGQVLETPLPTILQQAVAADAKLQMLAHDIAGGLEDAPAHDVHRYLMSIRERRSDRARYVLRMAVEPTPTELSILKLPRPLFPLYRVLRLGRFAGLGVTAGLSRVGEFFRRRQPAQ